MRLGPYGCPAAQPLVFVASLSVLPAFCCEGGGIALSLSAFIYEDAIFFMLLI